MSANTPTTRGLPWARIGAALFVLGCMLASVLVWASLIFSVGKHWEDDKHFLRNYRAPNEIETQVAFTIDYALNSREDNDVIFLGDSTCRGCFITRQFERATGLKAFNLGSVALVGLDGHVVVLRHYLEHHPKPRIVVFCVVPKAFEEVASFRGPAEIRERFLWCYGGGGEDARPAHAHPYRDYLRLGGLVILGRLTGGFPHYANQPVPQRGAETCNMIAEELRQQRGYWTPSDPSGPGSARLQFLEDAAAILPANTAALNDLAHLTGANGIVLLIRLPPVPPGSGPRDSAFVKKWANDLEAKFPHLRVSRPVVLHYDVDCFADLDHCNRKGAQQITALAAEEVRRALGGNLPAPR